jgi:hypothetical protein
MFLIYIFYSSKKYLIEYYFIYKEIIITLIFIALPFFILGYFFFFEEVLDSIVFMNTNSGNQGPNNPGPNNPGPNNPGPNNTDPGNFNPQSFRHLKPYLSPTDFCTTDPDFVSAEWKLKSRWNNYIFMKNHGEEPILKDIQDNCDNSNGLYNLVEAEKRSVMNKLYLNEDLCTGGKYWKIVQQSDLDNNFKDFKVVENVKWRCNQGDLLYLTDTRYGTKYDYVKYKDIRDILEQARKYG